MTATKRKMGSERKRGRARERKEECKGTLSLSLEQIRRKRWVCCFLTGSLQGEDLQRVLNITLLGREATPTLLRRYAMQ